MGGKIRIFVIIAALVGMLVLAAACSGSNEVKIGSESAGKEVQVKVGQTLAVSLDSNPTTGYGWQVDQTDEALLKPQGDPQYKQSSSTKDLVGAGGTETLRFSALAAGKVTLKLAYRRSFETGVDPIQTYTVTVNIQ